MLNRRTTLILGAGASKPYGFPIGWTLLEHIRSNLREFRIAFESSGMAISVWDDTLQRLQAFQPTSIDHFLAKEKNPDRILATKMAIAYYLSQKELPNQHVLYGETIDNWYLDLLQVVLDDNEELGGGKLTITTFNYDQSLEIYLLKTLLARHHDTRDQAMAAIRNLRISHVHGAMGDLAELAGSLRPYAPITDGKILMSVAKGILTCYETGARDALAEAHKMISESNAVLFLGFGFSDENLRLLDLKAHMPAHAIVAASHLDCLGFQDRLQKHLHKPSELKVVGSGIAIDPRLTRNFLARLIQHANNG